MFPKFQRQTDPSGFQQPENIKDEKLEQYTGHITESQFSTSKGK